MTALRCPICGSPLRREGNSLYCGRERPHCFDIAKSGYVTLTRASGSAGDDRDMVRARTAFLASRAYEPLAKAITDALEAISPRVIIDAGCGEGYYTNHIASALPDAEVYGFDLSKYACDRAAKSARAADNGAFFGVSSLFELPIRDSSADAVINLFAPVAENEFARVLRGGGLLIIAAAGRRHLYELKHALYSEAYENEGRHDLPAGFEPIRHERLTYRFLCRGENIRDLFLMTPYAFRTSRSDAAKLDALTELDITADFDLFIYQKKE